MRSNPINDKFANQTGIQALDQNQIPQVEKSDQLWLRLIGKRGGQWSYLEISVLENFSKLHLCWHWSRLLLCRGGWVAGWVDKTSDWPVLARLVVTEVHELSSAVYLMSLWEIRAVNSHLSTGIDNSNLLRTCTVKQTFTNKQTTELRTNGPPAAFCPLSQLGARRRGRNSCNIRPHFAFIYWPLFVTILALIFAHISLYLPRYWPQYPPTSAFIITHISLNSA